MRTYDQYCAVAKALDVVGERWTLLIVRELLLRGPCRYTDLRDGLPGIATNLLAERIRQLEQAGVVSREQAPPPIATTLFALTPRGEQLKPTIDALARWGAPLMERPTCGEVFRGHWLAYPAELFLVDRAPDRPPVRIEVRVDGETMVLETVEGKVRARPGSSEEPDAVLAGPAHLVLGTLTGRLELAEARRLGLEYRGKVETLRRVQPPAAATGAPRRLRPRRARSVARSDV